MRALRVDLFIIPSQEDHVTTPIEPQSGYSSRMLFLGHVTDTHYVSSQDICHLNPLTNGGVSSGKQRKTLRNRCSIDGPLSWLLNMVQRYENLLTIFKTSNDLTLKILLKAFRCFEQIQFTEDKKVWFDYAQKSSLSESDQGNNCERNTYGSDSTFFEHLSRTPIAQMEVSQSKWCSNGCCNTARKTTIHKTNCSTA